MCAISKVIGLNMEKEKHLPNKKYISGHRLERTSVVVKCMVHMHLKVQLKVHWLLLVANNSKIAFMYTLAMCVCLYICRVSICIVVAVQWNIMCNAAGIFVWGNNVKFMYIWHIYGNRMGNENCSFLLAQLSLRDHAFM